MDARKVKELLNSRDIFDLLEELGAQPIQIHDGIIQCVTACHSGGSHKLYYYPEKKIFNCYTNCGVQDLFQLVGNILNLDFSESYKYVISRFNLRDTEVDNGDSGYVENPGLLLKQKLKGIEEPQIEILPRSLLTTYYDYYHRSWINEGISIETMKKYGIKYSIIDNQIIIPHMNEYGKLIGIRGRNLNQDLVDQGKKYMPIYSTSLKKSLKHPTGANLYGLDKNKEKIDEMKAAILFESEKSVLQLDSFLPELSIGLCISGSNLTNYQISLLKKRNISEIIIALDKEFDNLGDKNEILYAEKIEKSFVKRLSANWKVSVLWDLHNRLDKKDSPTDKGSEVFLNMMKERIILT